MTRVEHMRLYRSRLVNEMNSLVDNYIANPESTDVGNLNDRVRMLGERVRIMNVEIDKLEAIRYGRTDAQPNVPELALA